MIKELLEEEEFLPRTTAAAKLALKNDALSKRPSSLLTSRARRFRNRPSHNSIQGNRSARLLVNRRIVTGTPPVSSD